MPWPLPSHFRAMLQNPRLALRDPQLRACQIERDHLNQPRPWAGAFAVVYKAMLPGRVPSGWGPIALRAFSTESPERRERYENVSRYLRCRDLRCLVDFEYQDDGIRSAGDGKWYPLVVMEWVDGVTLFDWAGSKCRVGKGPSLAKAAAFWMQVVEELSQAQITHGDLQHANVMVTRQGRLKLVDYDGMGVVSLWGRRNLEIGVRPYQHPQRNESTLLAPELDRFSSLVIYVALRALAADTSLWQRYVASPGSDKLLFRAEDFADPAASQLRRDLTRSPDRAVRELCDTLFVLAGRDLEEVPPLCQLIRRRPPAAPSARKKGRKKGTGPICAQHPAGRSGKLDLSPFSSAAAGSEIRTQQAAPATARVFLDFVAGPMQGQSFLIDRHDTFLFGRGGDCHARICDDPRVSRHHFLLEAIPPGARLRDLGSRNGTIVNGVEYGGRSSAQPEKGTGPICRNGPQGAAHKLDLSPFPRYGEIELHDGDQIVVGSTTIRFRVECPSTVALPRAAREEKGASPICAQPGHPRFVGPGRRLVAGPSGKLDLSPFPVDIEDLEVVREIGKGRLGTVCLVTRKSDGRQLALKVASPKISTATIDRDAFLGALEELQRLQHANIVGLLGVGQIRRAHCFLMEYCNGGGIDRRMAEHGGRLPVPEAALLLRQCLAGLVHAHAQGIVHRDVKPQNVLIHRDGHQLVAKLADLGLSALFESAGLLGMTATCQAKIDYQFMPAERLTHFKQSDPRSDLWSLAATFFYALTGRAPRDFAGQDPIAVVLHAQTTALRVANPLVPEPLAEVMDRALRKAVPERFQTALEMQRALDEACGHRAQLGPGGLGLR